MVFAGSKEPPGRDSTAIMAIVKMSARRLRKLACANLHILTTNVLASGASHDPIADAN